MKKTIFTILFLTALIVSPCFSKDRTEEFPDQIDSQVQIKNRETDIEAQTKEVVFRQMERYLFDEAGNEIFYEDLSARDGFPYFDDRDSGALKFKINDKRRTSTYDKMGNKTSAIIERYGQEDIQWQREYDKNNKLIHSKDHPDDKEKAMAEIWYDSEGRIIHSINSYGLEEWYVFDKEGRTVSEKKRAIKNTPGEETKRKYDKNGKLLSEIVSYGNTIDSSLTNKYDKNGNLLYSIFKDCDSIREEKYNYSKEGLLVSSTIEHRFYDDEKYKVLLAETTHGEAEYSYDEKGLLVKKTERFTYEDSPEDDGVMETFYTNNEEGKVLTEVAKGYFTNTPQDNFVAEKNYYYEENGNWGYTTEKGEVFEFYPDGKKSIVTENRRYFTWYDREGREIRQQDKEDGILKYECFISYDDFGKKKNVKSFYYDPEGNVTENYERTTERDEKGRILHEKSFDSRGDANENYELWFEYDSHGNETFYKKVCPGYDDYVRNYEYQYDEKGNVIRYKDLRKSKWVKYDEHSFPTYLKLKSDRTSGYITDGGKAFYTEFFFINKYSFHKNGKVKECVRYYFENPNYHQNGEYNHVLERQPDAGE